MRGFLLVLRVVTCVFNLNVSFSIVPQVTHHQLAQQREFEERLREEQAAEALAEKRREVRGRRLRCGGVSRALNSMGSACAGW